MALEDIIESRIQDAMAAGAFDRLQGAGRPFSRNPAESLAGENWMGFKLLQNGGMLPEWLMLAKEIEDENEALRKLDDRHAALVRFATETGAWARHAGAIRSLRAGFEEKARALRARQDRFNMDAPALSLERPGIWVEYHLARLDGRLRDAGAPDDLFVASQ